MEENKKEKEEIKKINVKHSRFGDADWYGDPQDIIVGGTGGIGSWTAMFLGRIGHNLYLFDNDTIDETNMAGQLYTVKQIGKNKSDATKENILNFSGNENIECLGLYDENSPVSPIMFSCFDNMKARKLMFDKWCSQEDRELFIDGRMLAEDGIVLLVQKGQEDLYKTELFDDAEVKDAPCSFKATSHCGALIGSLMTAGLNNYLSNKKIGEEIRNLPFKTTFELSLFNFQKPKVEIPVVEPEKIEENV